MSVVLSVMIKATLHNEGLIAEYPFPEPRNSMGQEKKKDIEYSLTLIFDVQGLGCDQHLSLIAKKGVLMFYCNEVLQR